MRSIGGKLCDPHERSFDAVEHFIERIREPLQLITRLQFLKPAAQIGSADVTRSAYQRIYRSQSSAAHPVPSARGNQQKQWSKH